MEIEFSLVSCSPERNGQKERRQNITSKVNTYYIFHVWMGVHIFFTAKKSIQIKSRDEQSVAQCEIGELLDTVFKLLIHIICPLNDTCPSD